MHQKLYFKPIWEIFLAPNKARIALKIPSVQNKYSLLNRKERCRFRRYRIVGDCTGLHGEWHLIWECCLPYTEIWPQLPNTRRTACSGLVETQVSKQSFYCPVTVNIPYVSLRFIAFCEQYVIFIFVYPFRMFFICVIVCWIQPWYFIYTIFFPLS